MANGANRLAKLEAEVVGAVFCMAGGRGLKIFGLVAGAPGFPKTEDDSEAVVLGAPKIEFSELLVTAGLSNIDIVMMSMLIFALDNHVQKRNASKRDQLQKTRIIFCEAEI